MQSRFLEVRKFTGMGQVEFAARAKIKQSQVSEIENGKRNITAAIMISLEDAFNINRKWLETGEGEMLKPIELADERAGNADNMKWKPEPRLEAKPFGLVSDPNDYDNDGSKFEHQGDGRIRMRIKVVQGQKARAGYLRGFQDPEFFEHLETISIDVDQEFKGNYLGFEVTGDSMITTDPSQFHLLALPGWIAIARELPHHHWKSKLHIHKIDHWILVHETEGILCKNITHHDVEKGLITIHSANPEYKDEVLKLSDMAQIFAVHNFWVKKYQKTNNGYKSY